MEKRKILDIVKRVVIFVLGVAILVGSFLFGASYGRRNKRLISASADNWYDTNQIGVQISDMYAVDRIVFNVSGHSTLLTAPQSYFATIDDSLGEDHIAIQSYENHYYLDHVSGTSDFDTYVDINSSFEGFPGAGSQFSDYNDLMDSTLFNRIQSYMGNYNITYVTPCYFESGVNMGSVSLFWDSLVLPIFKYDWGGNVLSHYPSLSFFSPASHSVTSYDFYFSGKYCSMNDDVFTDFSATFNYVPSYDNIYDAFFSKPLYYLASHLDSIDSESSAFVLSDLFLNVTVHTTEEFYEFENCVLRWFSLSTEAGYDLGNLSLFANRFPALGGSSGSPGGSVGGGNITDVNIGEWLADSIKGIFAGEILPGLTLGGLFLTIIAVPICTWLLKLFAGG